MREMKLNGLRAGDFANHWQRRFRDLSADTLFLCSGYWLVSAVAARSEWAQKADSLVLGARRDLQV